MATTDPSELENLPQSIEQAVGGRPKWLNLLLAAVQLFRLLPPLLQLVIALAGLALATSQAWNWWRDSLHLSLLMAQAFKAQLETTTTPYQGLAAYLLADLPGAPTGDSSRLDTQQTAREMVSIHDTLLRMTQSRDRPQARDLIRHFGLRIEGSGPAWRQFLANHGDTSVFLHIPMISLRGLGPDAAPPQLDRESSLAAALSRNPELVSDLQAAAIVELHLEALLAQRIDGLPVCQAYLITEGGLLLIACTNAQNQPRWYGDQLAAYRFFTERPYFWRAVTNASTTRRRQEFYDLRTEPYFDLGGNGIVRTFACSVPLKAGRAAILCVDVALPELTRNAIQRRLNDIGAEHGAFQCPGEEPPSDFDWFATQLAANASQKADLLGAVTMEPPDSAGGDQIVRFTMPFRSSETPAGVRTTRILWIRWDMADFINRRLTYGLWTVVGLLLFLVAGGSMLLEYGVLRNEMNMVLENMTRVMWKAKTPFAWLNGRNEFVAANPAFLETLGYENLEHLWAEKNGRITTFRSLVVGEDQPVYDAVQAASARGRLTPEYEVRLVRHDGKRLRTLIHGERVPAPVLWGRRKPHRFGVLLRWTVEPKSDA